mmetsp:Transcript_13787/g.20127  ORF Transcript_13787/g.20127 Transcript_13787/m.20127 type:complete len:172 (-) Transcript_13787:12-527(-)
MIGILFPNKTRTISTFVASFLIVTSLTVSVFMSHRMVVSAYIGQRPRRPFHHVRLGAVRQQQQSTCRLFPQTVKHRNKSSVFDAFKSGRFSSIYNHIGVPTQKYDDYGLTRRYLSMGDSSITDRETNPSGNTDPYDDDGNDDNEIEMHDVDIDSNSDDEEEEEEEEEEEGR